MRTQKPPRQLRITGQNRTTRGFAYDLAVDDRALKILIEQAEAPGRWFVEARARDKSVGAEQSLSAESTSRADALREIGDGWGREGGPAVEFDWGAVTVLLDEVRAL